MHTPLNSLKELRCGGEIGPSKARTVVIVGFVNN